MPPRIDVFEIGAGGVIEKIDDWSQSGTRNVLKALEAELGQRRGLQLFVYDTANLPPEVDAELNQTQLLFDAVADSVALHVFGLPAQRFEDKFVNFDYSLGAETAKLNIVDADAFLIAKGVDHVSSPGRQALQLTTMMVAAAMGVVVIPQGGVTLMHLALVDARSGHVLWFGRGRSEGGTDLRNPSSAAAFISGALTGIPLP